MDEEDMIRWGVGWDLADPAEGLMLGFISRQYFSLYLSGLLFSRSARSSAEAQPHLVDTVGQIPESWEWMVQAGERVFVREVSSSLILAGMMPSAGMRT